MVVNVNVAQDGHAEIGLDQTDDLPSVRLDLDAMTQGTLAEIGRQICLVCKVRYSTQRVAGVLPCAHYFCA